MKPSTAGARAGERGAIVVQVAVMLAFLIGLGAIAVDYGVLWLARTEAQNAADAAALAGATALAFDSVGDTSIAQNAAVAAASLNKVKGEAATATDFEFSDCQVSLSGGFTTADITAPGASTCVKTTVYRDAANGNPLPTYFGHMLNIADQGVKATATAAAAPANASSCLYPLAIPDHWKKGSGTWNSSSSFVKYDGTLGYPTAATPADSYVAPSSTLIGDGFQISFLRLNGNYGLLTLTMADTATPVPGTPRNISAGQFVTVQVPRHAGSGYSLNMISCNGVGVGIGDQLALESSPNLATILARANARISLDSGTSWNSTSLRIANSCATSSPPCAPISPRLVALPVFDLNVYEDSRWQNGTPTIRIVNIVGFYINSVTSTSITGYLMSYPGDIDSSKSQVGYRSSFLRSAVLIR
jgi:Flp pilus assembly protein TadG